MAEFRFTSDLVYAEEEFSRIGTISPTGGDFDPDTGEWVLDPAFQAFPDAVEIILNVADEDIEPDGTMVKAGSDGEVTVLSITTVDAVGNETTVVTNDKIKFGPDPNSADEGSTFLFVEGAKVYFLAPGTSFTFDESGNTLTIDDKNEFGGEWDFDNVCFAAGTKILTPDGEVAVESLRIGQIIRTANGLATRVKWVGRQTVHKRFTPRERFEPVCVSAGALGNGLPVRDLVLTADHALIVDGLLVQACALVNGTTIRRINSNELAERVTYYHVETEGHEVILAEGTPAETFVDNVSRRLFDNFSEYAALYGEDAEVIPEMSAPRVMSARQLPETLRKRFGSAMTG